MKKKILIIFILAAVFSLVGYAVYAQVTAKPSFEIDTSCAAPPCGPMVLDNTTNPVGRGFEVSPAKIDVGGQVTFLVEAADVSGVKSVRVDILNSAGIKAGSVALFDDGQHGDGAANDGIFSNIWEAGQTVAGIYNLSLYMEDNVGSPTNLNNYGTLIVGGNLCSSNSDCSEPNLPQCCTNVGLCAVANACSVNSDCDAGNPDPNSYLSICDDSSCPSICTYEEVPCQDGDGMCPASCTPQNDNDCAEATPPNINIISPAGAEPIDITDANTDVVAQTWDTSGVTKVDFYLDGGAPIFTETALTGDDTASPGATATWVFDWSTVSSGIHTITSTSTDTYGNSASASISVNVNISFGSNPPSNVNITSPSANSTFDSGSSFSIVAHAEDDVDIDHISYYSITNGLIGTQSASGAADTSVDLTQNTSAVSGIIAYFNESKNKKVSSHPLPFIKEVRAAAGGNTNCTTTTNTYWDYIYAIAYDSDNNTTQSPLVHIGRVVTSTSCSGGGSGSSSGGV